ncbi:unnamed protein product [Microthlaspi erraticum]|uniref:F-box associated beta-propeller type 1 domain-containing protein n=1 Tax=Microthlaspi erraticum TaxID=1685480 RepID=A0A6D2KIX8_9BRAS|nr:unnamed protein product [Microthlaspi erraticum]
MSVFVNNEDDLSAEHKGKLTCLDEQVKISRVFHCEGLLLCILEDDPTRVVVWNPYLGQTRWIELKGPHVLPVLRRVSYRRKEFCYGIGYANKGSGRNYKILRFVDGFLYKEGYDCSRYEIYDFETGLWKTLYITDPYWRITSRCGVSLKGNSYWCATKRDEYDCGWGLAADHIICFDYTSERFGPLLPLPYWVESHCATLSCLREEKLVAQYDQGYPYGLSYWITTTLEAEKVSWSHFTYKPYDEYFKSFDEYFKSYEDYSTIDDIHIRLSFKGFYEEKKVPMFSGQRLNCYLVRHIGGDENGGYYQESNKSVPGYDDRITRQCVCFYVPSLVQIKQPKGERKQSNVVPEQARSSLFLSTNSFASLASSDDEE